LRYRLACSATIIWLSCVAFARAADSPAAAPVPEAAAAPEDEIVCRYEKPTGSHMRVKVCRTRAQIEEAAREARRAMGEARTRGTQHDVVGE
jgi:hypothetical protein